MTSFDKQKLVEVHELNKIVRQSVEGLNILFNEKLKNSKLKNSVKLKDSEKKERSTIHTKSDHPAIKAHHLKHSEDYRVISKGQNKLQSNYQSKSTKKQPHHQTLPQQKKTSNVTKKDMKDSQAKNQSLFSKTAKLTIEASSKSKVLFYIQMDRNF